MSSPGCVVVFELSDAGFEASMQSDKVTLVKVAPSGQCHVVVLYFW